MKSQESTPLRKRNPSLSDENQICIYVSQALKANKSYGCIHQENYLFYCGLIMKNKTLFCLMAL